MKWKYFFQNFTFFSTFFDELHMAFIKLFQTLNISWRGVNISWKYMEVSCKVMEKVHREFAWAQAIVQEMNKDAVIQNINKQIRSFSSTWICIMALEVHPEKTYL